MKYLLFTLSLPNITQETDQTVSLTDLWHHLLPLWGIDLNYRSYGIAFFSLIVALCALFVAIQDYRYSQKTAKNVERISKGTQIALFNDQIRHLYRNLVCTLAFSFKQIPSLIQGNITERIREKQLTDTHTYYISEEHLLKLKMLPEDIIKLEKYNNDSHIYRKMHELKILMRNYDMEVDVTLRHCTNPHIAAYVLAKDFTDTLAFKPLYLIKHIVEIETAMFAGRQEQQTKRKKEAAMIMLAEHFNKLVENLSKNDLHTTITEIIAPDGEEVGNPELFLHAIQEIISRSATIFKELYQETFAKDSESYYILREEFLSPQNTYLREDARNLFENLPQELPWQNYFHKYFHEKTWNFTEILPVVLSVDVLIEYGKIRTIDF